MRLELAGTLYSPDPIILTFSSNQNFIPQTYLDLGYTLFDVICIGGAGGSGGGIDTNNTGTLVKNYGGAGGGGGYHRVQGKLDALPATCAIVVGLGGSKGNDHASDPSLTSYGGNGGASTFNGTTCMASGGEGGWRVSSNSLSVSPAGIGGLGGIGGRTAYGGGGARGSAGTPNGTTPGINSDGGDGRLIGGIGEGGGGGVGGLGKYGASPNLYQQASNGGRGSYNSIDLSAYGPGFAAQVDAALPGSPLIIPAGASGAKASALNGLPTVYGQSVTGKGPGGNGIVVIRLYSES